MEKISEPESEIGLLQRKSLKEELFEILQHQIIAGKYAPGEWLRQEEISSQFHVSQTPVREALDLLVSTGLAERVPYRGVRVIQLTQQEMVDAYILRLILESIAAGLAAQNADADQTEFLFKTLQATRDLLNLQDMPRLRELNRDFHKTIVMAAGNALLFKLYDLASNTFPDWMLYEAMFRHPELLASSLNNEYHEHLEIANAIASHQPGEAARTVWQHIYNLGASYNALLAIPQAEIWEKERQILAFLCISK